MTEQAGIRDDQRKFATTRSRSAHPPLDQVVERHRLLLGGLSRKLSGRNQRPLQAWTERGAEWAVERRLTSLSVGEEIPVRQAGDWTDAVMMVWRQSRPGLGCGSREGEVDEGKNEDLAAVDRGNALGGRQRRAGWAPVVRRKD